MTDPDYDDEQLPVPDGVDDSIPTHSDPIPIVPSGELYEAFVPPGDERG